MHLLQGDLHLVEVRLLHEVAGHRARDDGLQHHGEPEQRRAAQQLRSRGASAWPNLAAACEDTSMPARPYDQFLSIRQPMGHMMAGEHALR